MVQQEEQNMMRVEMRMTEEGRTRMEEEAVMGFMATKRTHSGHVDPQRRDANLTGRLGKTSQRSETVLSPKRPDQLAKQRRRGGGTFQRVLWLVHSQGPVRRCKGQDS